MRLVCAVVRLTRLDFCLLTFLSVFVPFAVRTGAIGESCRRAIPLLFIGMCTFIVNDVDDMERDAVNHPDRPLPSGQLAPVFAVMFYFTCLAVALLTIRAYIGWPAGFWYYLLLIAAISYGYVTEFLPALKAPYVSACIAVPVIIIAISYPDEPGLKIVASSLFLFALGREACGDIVDRAGDKPSIWHSFGANETATVAFILQVLALILLATLVADIGDGVALVVIGSMSAISGYLWFRCAKPDAAITVMKAQMFVGLYFVV